MSFNASFPQLNQNFNHSNVKIEVVLCSLPNSSARLENPRTTIRELVKLLSERIDVIEEVENKTSWKDEINNHHVTDFLHTATTVEDIKNIQMENRRLWMQKTNEGRAWAPRRTIRVGDAATWLWDGQIARGTINSTLDRRIGPLFTKPIYKRW